jgi:hypothetical protein
VRILLWGLGVPTAVLLLQIVWWRVRRPAADVRLLTLLLVVALVGFAALAALPVSSAALAMPQGWLAVLYSLALAGAVSLLYLITYAGLDAKSPSTLIVLAAEKAETGLTMEEAATLFTDEEFIVQRVEGLVRIGQLRRSGENLHLTMHGRIFLESFLLPRRIMGLQHWGG